MALRYCKPAIMYDLFGMSSRWECQANSYQQLSPSGTEPTARSSCGMVWSSVADGGGVAAGLKEVLWVKSSFELFPTPYHAIPFANRQERFGRLLRLRRPRAEQRRAKERLALVRSPGQQLECPEPKWHEAKCAELACHGLESDRRRLLRLRGLGGVSGVSNE